MQRLFLPVCGGLPYTPAPGFPELLYASVRIAVAPSDPNVIYVGASETDPRSQISYGDGVYKSTDAGKTWVHLGLDKTLHISRVIVDPHNPNRVLVATLGNLYAANPERGVCRSLDGGTTWIELKNGLPTEGVGKIGPAVAPSNPNCIYAIIDTKQGGLYRSDDDGASFDEIRGAPGGDDYHRLWINPSDPDRMVLSSDQGAIVSVDGAKSWGSWNNQPTDQYYGISANNPTPFWVPGPMQDSGGHSVASDVMSSRIRALQSKVGAAGQLREQLGTMGARASGGLAKSIKALDAKAMDILGYAPPPSPDTSGVGDRELASNSLKGLGASLQGLSLPAQQGGLDAPNQANVAGFGKVQNTAAVTLVAWQRLQVRDVEQINAQLRKTDLTVVTN